MDFQAKLQEKIEEHNKVLQELERLSALRQSILGQIELLQELANEDKSPAKRPKAKA